MGGLKESPEPSKQEVARRRQRVQEKEEEREGLEQPNAGMRQVSREKLSQLISRAENLLTTFPFSDLLRERGSQAKEKMAMAPSTGQ